MGKEVGGKKGLEADEEGALPPCIEGVGALQIHRGDKAFK